MWPSSTKSGPHWKTSHHRDRDGYVDPLAIDCGLLYLPDSSDWPDVNVLILKVELWFFDQFLLRLPSAVLSIPCRLSST
jgi:hypothetical protein